MSNRDKLKSIKATHGLTSKDIAEICKVSIRTVSSWLLPDTSKTGRACPDMAIELLNCTLNK